MSSVLRRPLRRFMDDEFPDEPLNGHQRYKHITNHLRWVIINMFELHSLKLSVVSRMTTIPRRTCSRIRAHFHDHGGVWSRQHLLGRRGKLGDCKLTRAHKEILRTIIHTKPVSYLNEICTELYYASGIIASPTVVRRALQGMGYTRRRLSRIFHQANVFDRVNFRENVRPYLFDLTQLLFLDETSKNRASINRMYGWGPKRRSVFNKNFVLNGKRMSVVGAYNLSGIVAMDVTPNTFDRALFEDFFFNKVVPILRPFPHPNSIVIIDNARIHECVTSYCG